MADTHEAFGSRNENDDDPSVLQERLHREDDEHDNPSWEEEVDDPEEKPKWLALASLLTTNLSVEER